MELVPPAEKADAISRRFDVTMRAYAKSVHLTRDLVDRAVKAWGLDPEIRYDGHLVITELASNACALYEGQQITVWVATPEPDSGLLEVCVRDPDAARLPKVLPPSADSVSGRGLYIVRELTGGRLGWYASRATGGKVVFGVLGP
jgi:anti-sigma regulatory factor (Ser/Thr protein kinase)